MKNKMYNEWIDEIKLEIIDLVLLFKMIKEEVILMLYTNGWILNDINLFESFVHLKEMIDISNSDLDKFIERIKMLDNNLNIFYVSDLKDEFDIIKENIYLEAGFITNMIDYMAIVDDVTINDNEIIKRLEQYQDNDISCYNQMKINNENLKQLRKERRDYFE